MEVRATYKYAKISPFKAREITREIQGLPVSAALDVVAYSPKKAAALINKTLKSAVANAENNANLKVDGLVVKEAIVGEGPTMKRMMARARGSGNWISIGCEPRLAVALVRIPAGDAGVFAQRYRDSRLREKEASVRRGIKNRDRTGVEFNSRHHFHSAPRHCYRTQGC